MNLSPVHTPYTIMAMARTFTARPSFKPRTYRKGRTYAPRANPKTMVVRGFTRMGGVYGRFRGRRSTDTEMKLYDKTLSNTLINATGIVPFGGTLNDIAQGDTESQRIGRKVVVKSIHLHLRLALAPTTSNTATADNIRIMVVLDKQANGTAFINTDVLTVNAGSAPDFYSFNNIANKSRFRVLSDKKYQLSADAAFTSTSVLNSCMADQHIKCNIPIEYDHSATTGAISTIRSNNIAILAISEQGLGTFMQGTARIRYTDN